MQKSYTINELVKADWFPYQSRITIRKYIDSGELKASIAGTGGIMRSYSISATNAHKFANKIYAKYNKKGK